MVTLTPNSPVDSKAARAVAIELAKLPINLLNPADAEGLTIPVTHDNVTTYHTHLAGAGARGHSSGGWDKLPGVGAFGGSKETVIAMEQDGSGKWRVASGNSPRRCQSGAARVRPLRRPPAGCQHHRHQPEQGQCLLCSLVYDYNKLGDTYFQQAGPNGDYEPGLEESFAEGLARLYGNNNAFAHWNHIEVELLKL